MRIFKRDWEVKTTGKGTYEITKDLSIALAEAQISEGLATVFVKHTSCSLVLMENADPTARRDLEQFFEDLVPEDYPHFTHTYEGPDDMPSHIKMALTVQVKIFRFLVAGLIWVLGRVFFSGSIDLLHIDENCPSL